MRQLMVSAALVVACLSGPSAQPAPADLNTPQPAQTTRRKPAAAGTAITTDHVTVTPASSAASVAPGARFSLFIDVAPKPRMHVYSPDQTAYIPVAFTLQGSEMVNPHAPVFPASERYLFEPLKEEQRVYSKPFRIVQDVTVPANAATRARARTGGTITMTGTLHYQACDDVACYRPVDVPLTWTVKLTPPR